MSAQMTEHHNIDGRMFAHKTCGKCGVEFLLPKTLDDENREKGADRTWYCPNGHARIYSESDTAKYRREAERLKQQLAMKDDEIARERDRRQASERTTAAYKGQITKIKTRVKAGVCPCCNRQFQDLHRHMQTKHPDFDPAENVVPFDPKEKSA